MKTVSERTLFFMGNRMMCKLFANVPFSGINTNNAFFFAFVQMVVLHETGEKVEVTYQ